MAEKIVSPGVFTNEVDQSFLPAGVAAIGAAVVGPTTKGPAGIPTVVSSYGEFQNIFGGKFSSGSGAQENAYKYLTSYAAQEYLKYADTLTVVRIMAGAFSPASAIVSSSTTVGATVATGSFTFLINPTGSLSEASDEIIFTADDGTVVNYTFVSSSAGLANTAEQVFVDFGQNVDDPGAVAANVSGDTGAASNLANAINAAETAGTTTLGISASAAGAIVEITASSAGTAGNLTITTGSGGDATATTDAFIVAGTSGDSGANNLELGTFGGINVTTSANAFTFTTLTDGEDQNSDGPHGTNNLLASGSINNIRWEVLNVNNNKGTFNLLVRRGDDTIKRKSIVEQFNNVTLDPNSPNYIARVVGDQVQTMRDSGELDPYLQLSGSFPNRSKYVRVTVHQTTYNYLDENGNVRDGNLSGSLPQASSGSFGGGSDGFVAHPRAFYEDISNNNSQGFNVATAAEGKNAYIDAIRLLKNQDEYDINLLSLPGMIDNHSDQATILTEALDMCESRADCFLIIDPVEYGQAITQATAKAESRDSNYAAVYWPWVKIPDNDLGRNVWVPSSTVIPSVYAFNDRVAAPWFAPAGLNRGGIDIAVQTERKLTHANRDTLYESNVNPIATFPNAGVTVFGQKTLQKKASALDRVNVRRLLIAAKKFIASTTKFLIFENNTAATRNRFLAIVNPYFESVQQRQGLFAFKVVMDETTNTPDVIDRNEMRGQIFLQPAKAAEFIIIDFNILPTGAAFPE